MLSSRWLVTSVTRLCCVAGAAVDVLKPLSHRGGCRGKQLALPGSGQPHAKCLARLTACALSQEVAAKQSSWLCLWRGGASPKVGALEAAAGDGAGEESKAVAVDLGKAFLHAFIIPNYKARTLRNYERCRPASGTHEQL